MKLENISPPKCLYKHKNFALALEEYKEKYSNQYKLYEGLITSHPREKLIQSLKKRFPNSMNLQYEKKNNDLNIFLHHTKPIKIPDLKQLLNNFGWFITEIELNGNSFKGNDKNAEQKLENFDFNQAWVIVHPKYDVEIKKIPPFLFHATPSNKVDKILKIGLSPKTQSALAYHPERIYLTSTIQGAEGLLQHMGSVKEIDEWSILQINPKKIPNLRGVSYFKLYKDPSFERQGRHFGMYTLNNIPPSAMKVVKTIS